MANRGLWDNVVRDLNSKIWKSESVSQMAVCCVRLSRFLCGMCVNYVNKFCWVTHETSIYFLYKVHTYSHVLWSTAKKIQRAAMVSVWAECPIVMKQEQFALKTPLFKGRAFRNGGCTLSLAVNFRLDRATIKIFADTCRLRVPNRMSHKKESCIYTTFPVQVPRLFRDCIHYDGLT